MESWAPKIIAAREVWSNRWIQVRRKDVLFTPDQAVADYYCLALDDYVAAVATTPSGLIPLVRQYRPAVEQYTLELPAGHVDAGEKPATACIRELAEETGLQAIRWKYVGAFLPDSGRLENRQHVFTVEAEGPVAGFSPEDGMTVEYVTRAGLKAAIADGRFSHLLHIAAIYLSKVLDGP